jgi:hypothetical protein
VRPHRRRQARPSQARGGHRRPSLRPARRAHGGRTRRPRHRCRRVAGAAHRPRSARASTRFDQGSQRIRRIREIRCDQDRRRGHRILVGGRPRGCRCRREGQTATRRNQPGNCRHPSASTPTDQSARDPTRPERLDQPESRVTQRRRPRAERHRTTEHHPTAKQCRPAKAAESARRDPGPARKDQAPRHPASWGSTPTTQPDCDRQSPEAGPPTTQQPTTQQPQTRQPKTRQPKTRRPVPGRPKPAPPEAWPLQRRRPHLPFAPPETKQSQPPAKPPCGLWKTTRIKRIVVAA